jgi:AcrR family transcriptional regulator
MPVKSRRSEYKELTRTAVLEAAAGQFVARGYAATSIDDVAGLARVSKGAVYYHFADKAHLFEAVFRDRQTRLLDRVTAAVHGHDGPWEQLQAGLDAYLAGAVADPVHRLLIQEAPVALGAGRCREIDGEIGLPVLRAALENLADSGDLIEQPVEMLARILFGALCEAVMAAGTDPHPTQAGRQAAAALRALTIGLHRQA